MAWCCGPGEPFQVETISVTLGYDGQGPPVFYNLTNGRSLISAEIVHV
jgi:hypothetical protein